MREEEGEKRTNGGEIFIGSIRETSVSHLGKGKRRSRFLDPLSSGAASWFLAACPRNVYIYIQPAPFHPPSTPLFCSCFKIFGLYERGRRVHKLYDVVSCDAKNRSASRNIMSRRLFPRAENTADKAHKLLRTDGGQREGGRVRTCPTSCHVASNIPRIRPSSFL